jgi:hypothetical protein
MHCCFFGTFKFTVSEVILGGVEFPYVYFFATSNELMHQTFDSYSIIQAERMGIDTDISKHVEIGVLLPCSALHLDV